MKVGGNRGQIEQPTRITACWVGVMWRSGGPDHREGEEEDKTDSSSTTAYVCHKPQRATLRAAIETGE